MNLKQIADHLVTNRRALRSRKGKPCPVCGHSDQHCVAMDDGSAAFCPKSDGAGSVKRYGEYGYLYIFDTGLSTRDVAMLPPVRKQPELSDEELHAIWNPRAILWWRDAGAEVGRLALVLGVASWSLSELCVGWDGKAWTFPERNGEGLIVGVNRRFEDGGKRCATGSHRGLTYSETWSDNPGPILLVEGGSDTAAGITLGLAVIGRPSNTGGVAMLVKMLADTDRKVIAIGERDRKADGRWPGMDGAKGVSSALAKKFMRQVACRLLPGGAKDLRAWFLSQRLDVSDCDACFAAGQALVKGW